MGTYELLTTFKVPLILTSAVFITIISYVLKKCRIDEKFYPVSKVSKLIIYPFKSCPGIQVPWIEVDIYGCKYKNFIDRMWVLTDEKGTNIGTYHEPSLTLINVQMKENQLWLNADGMDTLKLDYLEENVEDMEDIKVCQVYSTGIYCGDEVSGWFEKYLNRPGVRVYQSITSISKPAKKSSKQKSKLPTLFDGLTIVNILSEASVDDLNNRLKDKISIKNFRPNILVTGTQPFEEDQWKKMKIGESAEIARLKPCERCISTTVDPVKGMRDPKMETLKTLKTYRIAKNPIIRKIIKDSPMFSVNCTVNAPGKISVGDQVFAQKDTFVY